MVQQEPLLVIAGVVIFLLSIYTLVLRIKLWFIGRAISLLTSWIPGQENNTTFDNSVSQPAGFGDAFLVFIWIFNIVGLYWILTH